MRDQTYQEFEILVVDDGSTDDSVNTLEELQETTPNLRIIRNTSNLGVTKSLENAIASSSGDYLAFQGADDLLSPLFVEQSLSLLARYPQAGLCCSIPGYIGHENGFYSRGRQPKWLQRGGYWAAEEFATELKGSYVSGHTCIFKKRTLVEVGGFLPQLRWHCDWFASLLVSFREGVCCVPEMLAGLRVRRESYSARGRANWSEQSLVVSELLKLLKAPEYKDVLPLFEKSRALRHVGADLIRLLYSTSEFVDPLDSALVQRLVGRGYLIRSRFLLHCLGWDIYSSILKG